MNYRKFYKDTTKIEIPDGHVVHHVDHDRCNNLISNLVSIPKQLHIEYHKFYLEAQLFGIINLINIRPNSNSNIHISNVSDICNFYLNSVDKISRWMKVRNDILTGRSKEYPINVNPF